MKTKYQWARMQIIDRELNKHDLVKTKDLVKIIKRELDIPVSSRTIQKDLEQMQEEPPMGFTAPIGKDVIKKAYFYKEPFTIRAFGLKEEHINALLFYSKTIHQYHEYKIFSDIAIAIEKVLNSAKIMPGLRKLVKSRVIIQTEKALPIKGHEYIPVITQALEENKKISFEYRPFGKKSSQRKLSPCLLKEDKHMWYILGILEGQNFPRTFALDRIFSLVILEENFEPYNFNHEEYFKYSFGITVLDVDPTEVILSFSPSQGNYLKALPIHWSQNIIKDNNREFRISLQVKPSYEFYAKVLSYGASVKVIKPKAIADEVKKLIRNNLLRYS